MRASEDMGASPYRPYPGRLMQISDLVTDDLERALALNNAAVPAVNALDLAELARLHDMAAHALAVRVDGPAAFALEVRRSGERAVGQPRDPAVGIQGRHRASGSNRG